MMIFARRFIISLIMLSAMVSGLSCEGGEGGPETFTSYIDSTAQKTSLEEANTMIGTTVPVPTYLPEGYQIREVYVDATTWDDPKEKAIIILLISDEELGEKELVSQETQQHYVFQPKMYMHITWNRGEIPGGLKMPWGESLEIRDEKGHIQYDKAVLVDEGDHNDLTWLFAPTPGDTQFKIVLSVNKNIHQRELIKIVESMSLDSSSLRQY